MDGINGTHYLSELVRTLSENRNIETYTGNFIVTAIVNGEVKISGALIQCHLGIKHDSVDVSIFWEDCGYADFQDMGLYGRTNSRYFTVEELSKSSFKIIDRNNRSNETIFTF